MVKKGLLQMIKELCAYCGKWFPVDTMKQLPKKEYGNYYCPKCYPIVIDEYWKLPWNKRE